MNLQSYLIVNQITAAAFARIINVDTATVLRIKHRKVVPHRRTLVRIIRATNGQVTACDLLGVVEFCEGHKCRSQPNELDGVTTLNVAK